MKRSKSMGVIMGAIWQRWENYAIVRDSAGVEHHVLAFTLSPFHRIAVS